jgi:hypothetical protein
MWRLGLCKFSGNGLLQHDYFNAGPCLIRFIVARQVPVFSQLTHRLACSCCISLGLSAIKQSRSQKKASRYHSQNGINTLTPKSIIFQIFMAKFSFDQCSDTKMPAIPIP